MIARLLELPRPLLVALILGVGILVIIAMNPPYTVCDSQLEIFKKNQTGFLYPNPLAKLAKSIELDVLKNQCKETNSPGGCYELFMKMKQLLSDIERVPQDCSAEVSALAEVRDALWGQARLMVELAWGVKPPVSFYDKLSWLDPADLSLFCHLKQSLENLYGEDQFAEFREKLFAQLPGASGMPRAQAWDMMLLSVNCSRYF